MADPTDYRYNAQGQPVPSYNQATPGFSGAILDFVRALAGAMAPRSVTQRRANIEQQTNAASDPNSLGNQF